MVKGVNKNIIEVNDTGSEIFEKIVFYVAPKYGNLGAKVLDRASKELEKTFSTENTTTYTLRKIVSVKKRRRKIAVFSALSLLTVLGITLYLILR